MPRKNNTIRKTFLSGSKSDAVTTSMISHVKTVTANDVAAPFAELQLKKYGWEPGQGLGKHKEGMTRAIRVAKKNDTKGLGVGREEWGFAWWDHVYNGALNNIKVATTKSPDGDSDVQVSKIKKYTPPRNRMGLISTSEYMYGNSGSLYSDQDGSEASINNSGDGELRNGLGREANRSLIEMKVTEEQLSQTTETTSTATMVSRLVAKNALYSNFVKARKESPKPRTDAVSQHKDLEMTKDNSKLDDDTSDRELERSKGSSLVDTQKIVEFLPANQELGDAKKVKESKKEKKEHVNVTTNSKKKTSHKKKTRSLEKEVTAAKEEVKLKDMGLMEEINDHDQKKKESGRSERKRGCELKEDKIEKKLKKSRKKK
ncbi:hypothetical protein G9A89_022015 [Geosiphon pyriformis]|nr:hypothetical protein G9A89_022015 [Geosiphon pyriformis]